MPAVTPDASDATSHQEQESQKRILEYKAREDSLALREQEVQKREETLEEQLAAQQRTSTASMVSSIT